MRFAVVGDSESGTLTQLQVASCLATAAVDLVLHTGDLGYPALSAALADLRCLGVYAPMMRRGAWYPTLGHHELYGPEKLAPYWAPGRSPPTTRRALRISFLRLWPRAFRVAVRADPDPIPQARAPRAGPRQGAMAMVEQRSGIYGPALARGVFALPAVSLRRPQVRRFHLQRGTGSLGTIGLAAPVADPIRGPGRIQRPRSKLRTARPCPRGPLFHLRRRWLHALRPDRTRFFQPLLRKPVPSLGMRGPGRRIARAGSGPVGRGFDRSVVPRTAPPDAGLVPRP